MTCKNFEEKMSTYFYAIDETVLCHGLMGADRDLSFIEAQNDEHAAMINHATTCDECACTLLQYQEIKERVDYHTYPCFHVAYFSTQQDVVCLEDNHGIFSVLCKGTLADGVGIGFCPWCGVPLPTSQVEQTEADNISMKAWVTKNMIKKRN